MHTLPAPSPISPLTPSTPLVHDKRAAAGAASADAGAAAESTEDSVAQSTQLTITEPAADADAPETGAKLHAGRRPRTPWVPRIRDLVLR